MHRRHFCFAVCLTSVAQTNLTLMIEIHLASMLCSTGRGTVPQSADMRSPHSVSQVSSALHERIDEEERRSRIRGAHRSATRLPWFVCEAQRPYSLAVTAVTLQLPPGLDPSLLLPSFLPARPRGLLVRGPSVESLRCPAVILSQDAGRDARQRLLTPLHHSDGTCTAVLVLVHASDLLSTIETAGKTFGCTHA